MRCINIDWLEVYCLETSGFRPMEYYQSVGIFCKSREYGTKHWEEVFTIYDQYGDPFIEVRRHPRSKTGQHTILPDNACTLRLVNRYCYFDNAAELMADFINAYGYEFRRIYRLDLCCDFERFDSGDIPKRVVKRILAHTYAKVYQAKRTIHGDDRWTGSVDNSLSWGNKNSMVVTRFYDKTMELAEGGWKKPWIVQAWFESGLIDNPIHITRKNKLGEEYRPEIWRLEFQVNSSARGYLQIERDEGRYWVEHNLDTYLTRERLEQPYKVLQQHYFQWRIYQRDKKKYDCPEKILFKWEADEYHYKLMNTANERLYNSGSRTKLNQLYKIRNEIGDAETLRAMNKVIQYLEDRMLDDFKYNGISPKILQLMMHLDDRHRTESYAREIAQELF